MSRSEKFTSKLIVNFLRRVCEIFEPVAAEDCNETSMEEDLFDEIEDFEVMSSSYSEEVDNIIIPERKFPRLSRSLSSMGGKYSISVEYKTLETLLECLDNLVGLEVVKKQIYDIKSFIIRSNERYIANDTEYPSLYYNTVISGNSGVGKSSIGKIIAHLYLFLGVVGRGKLIYIDSKEIFGGSILDRFIGDTQSGVIIIDNVHLLQFDGGIKVDSCTTISNWISSYRDNFVFVLIGEEDGVNKLMAHQRINGEINFALNIPDFDSKETLELIKYLASKEKYGVHKDIELKIIKHIDNLKINGLFDNYYSARQIIDKAIVNNGAYDNALKVKDFEIEDIRNEKEKAKFKQLDSFDELERMIGLDEIKRKIKEISAFTQVQLSRKKLGLTTRPLCLHMSFNGNPGTGKTTVARLLGRILNEIGVLETDKFVEVSRKDLVGEYVGHTAIKTSKKIKEAEGGILFIDEAYSLYSEGNVDFGKEAVNVLVKEMEDLRGNLVIIFAGYPYEMRKLIDMNPGLRDRIQYNLEFSDYSPKELLEIWEKLILDDQYSIDDNTLLEMELLCKDIYSNRGENFSNARTVRKLHERVKIHQSMRIINKDFTDRDNLSKITIEDILALYGEKDLTALLNKHPKRCFGFHI